MKVDSNPPIIVPIYANTEASLPEWVILELNGELTPPVLLPEDKEIAEVVLGGAGKMELGSIRMENKKVPYMVLGSHELKGSIEQLKEPFCVFEKHTKDTPNPHYQIVGVVRKKLLFNQYPKIIMR